ncbi:hypothetical protein ACHQM5_008898 [Ranunculus cassubicifolius]
MLVLIFFYNVMQVPVAVGVTLYEAVALYKGQRVIASKGEVDTYWKVHQLVLYSFCGVIAGMVGGLLGLGGGFILGPLFLELGVPPQVSSATATFAMTFSSSMYQLQELLLLVPWGDGTVLCNQRNLHLVRGIFNVGK